MWVQDYNLLAISTSVSRLVVNWLVFSNPRDEIEIGVGIATVVASGGSLTQSINQSIYQW